MSRLTQRYPTLVAAATYALAVALAFWPFWTGHALFNALSDMNRVYPFRLFAAEFFKQFHAVPQWTPYLFGGMPYAANPTFGDTFYPGFILRLILPVDLGMTFGMMLHITLAGIFTFLFLRELKLEWGAAFVGGAAYLFTGMVVSLVFAGHDGKIIVSSLLPLSLLFLYRGVAPGLALLPVVRGRGGTESPVAPRAAHLLRADGRRLLLAVPGGVERGTARPARLVALDAALRSGPGRGIRP